MSKKPTIQELEAIMDEDDLSVEILPNGEVRAHSHIKALEDTVITRDPTYVTEEVEANPVWHLAWSLSEIENDNAPIGWSRYIPTARNLLNNWNITRKDTAPAVTQSGQGAPDVEGGER